MATNYRPRDETGRLIYDYLKNHGDADKWTIIASFYLVICAAPDFRSIGSSLGGQRHAPRVEAHGCAAPRLLVPQSALQERLMPAKPRRKKLAPDSTPRHRLAGGGVRAPDGP